MRARWILSDSELVDVTPQRGRDLLVECFLRAQCEAEGWCESRVRTDTGRREMRDTVADAIRLKFIELGIDWEEPTPDCISRAVDALVCEADAWGVSSEILGHHVGQMRKIQYALSA